MSGRVVNSQVVAEPLDQAAGMVGSVGIDAHPEEFSGADTGYLVVASFEDEVVVYGFTFRVSGEGLVFDDNFYCVALLGHLHLRLNLERY